MTKFLNINIFLAFILGAHFASAATYCSKNSNDPHYIKSTGSSYYGFDSNTIKLEICAHGTNECVQVGSNSTYATSTIFSLSKAEYFSALKKGALITFSTLTAGASLFTYFDTLSFFADTMHSTLVLGFGLAAFGANLIVKNVESLQPSRNLKQANNGIRIIMNSNAKNECLKVLDEEIAVEVVARQLGEKLDAIERENSANK